MTQKITLQRTVEYLKNNNNFFILTHKRPDGDTLGSAYALCHILRDMGKLAYVPTNGEITPKYAGLFDSCAPPEHVTPETVLAVDIANTSLVPEKFVPYLRQLHLAIDHHTQNNLPAEYLYIDHSAAAVGEQVFQLGERLCASISTTVAQCLYIALSTDTGCFKYANTTARTHRIVARLMDAGADTAGLNRILFETKTKQRLEVERELFLRLQFHENGRIAIMIIDSDLLKRTGAAEDDIDDLSALPRRIEGVLVGVTVRELSNGASKISVRSQGDIDSAAICALHGGGGHKNAAGCSLDMPPEQAAGLILADAARALPDAN